MVVLLSLLLHVILILLGNRRKYINRIWIKYSLWCAYLAADYVATVALGAIMSNFVDVYGNGGSLNSNIELAAFWSPFMLLHLGGPDTITAYSLEDNELWKRQFLGLVIRTGVVVCIVLMSWTGSFLSILSLMMFFAGLIKYGERTRVLRSGGSEQLRISSVAGDLADYKSGHSASMKEKYRPGRVRAVHELPIDFPDFEDKCLKIAAEAKLVTAYELINKIKSLFLDVVLSSNDKDTLTASFRNMRFEDDWEVMSNELGFMYYLLYTKAMVAHTGGGIALRFASFLLTCVSFVVFSLMADNKQQKYAYVELSITYLLLIAGIVLELYAALVQVSLNQTIVWLRNHKGATASRAIVPYISLLRTPGWSNSIGQYHLFS